MLMSSKFLFFFSSGPRGLPFKQYLIVMALKSWARRHLHTHSHIHSQKGSERDFLKVNYPYWIPRYSIKAICPNGIDAKTPHSLEEGQDDVKHTLSFFQSTTLYWWHLPSSPWFMSVTRQMLFCGLLWGDLPPSVLIACCFSSSLHLYFFTSHYPFPVSLLELRSALSIPVTVILLYFWSADFGCFLWLCVWFTILFYVSTVHIFKTMPLFKYCIRLETYHRILY